MQLEDYYSSPMEVKEPRWGIFLNRMVKNYSREEIAASFGIKGQSCLDLACGDGELLNRYLYKDFKKCLGVDIAKDLISKAKRNSRKNVRFVVFELYGFIRNTLAKKERFDSVYALAILEHIPWPTELLKDVAKIVKKGGHVVVEVPNVAWLPYRINLLLGRFPETAPTYKNVPGVQDEHIRFFTVSSLDGAFSKAGFVREKLDCSGRFRNIKRLWIELLSPDICAIYRKK